MFSFLFVGIIVHVGEQYFLLYIVMGNHGRFMQKY
jgi:hypothetical protein